MEMEEGNYYITAINGRQFNLQVWCLNLPLRVRVNWVSEFWKKTAINNLVSKYCIQLNFEAGVV